MKFPVHTISTEWVAFAEPYGVACFWLPEPKKIISVFLESLEMYGNQKLTNTSPFFGRENAENQFV
ncbi:MAG TPA: hypothetical protein PLB18_23055 [Acidobacteriota bacterium]|nr:hypothetical protein [Acidobacteriota bacterium]